MWKINILWKIRIIKLVNMVNRYLNAAGVWNLQFARDLKHRVAHLIYSWPTLNDPILTKVDRLRMYINTADARPYLSRRYEPYTTLLFKRAVRPATTVLDIGAQFGYYSLLAAKAMEKEGRVYAFEPAPLNFELLSRNIQMNGFANIIHPTQKAVGNENGTVTLFLFDNTDSHSMHRHPEASVKETLPVECITIDDFLGGQPADVVKMDIEGNEPYALEGMKQTISKSSNLVLFIEFVPKFLQKLGMEPNDYLAQLENFGFYVQIIDEKLHCLKPATKDSIPIENLNWYVNLYCTRKSVEVSV